MGSPAAILEPNRFEEYGNAHTHSYGPGDAETVGIIAQLLKVSREHQELPFRKVGSNNLQFILIFLWRPVSLVLRHDDIAEGCFLPSPDQRIEPALEVLGLVNAVTQYLDPSRQSRAYRANLHP